MANEETPTIIKHNPNEFGYYVSGKKAHPSCYFCKHSFVKYGENPCHNCSRINLVFDNYVENKHKEK